MEEREPRGVMVQWGALIVLSLTMFIVVLDTSMMNVAVPQITEDLDTSVSAVQTVVALYSLVMASLMLTGAKIGKIYGAKKVFRIALWIYGVGTLIAAFSWNIEVLALDELTPEEQQVFFEELDASVGGRLDEITDKARYDAMNASLLVLGVFVLLALIAALFLPKGRLADAKHPPDPDAQRFDKRAPYPERGT